MKAKKQRANDPRMIAIKEAMKKRQRAASQAIKERRKAAVAEQDRRQKEREAKMRADRDSRSLCVALRGHRRRLHCVAADTKKLCGLSDGDYIRRVANVWSLIVRGHRLLIHHGLLGRAC